MSSPLSIKYISSDFEPGSQSIVDFDTSLVLNTEQIRSMSVGFNESRYDTPMDLRRWVIG